MTEQETRDVLKSIGEALSTCWSWATTGDLEHWTNANPAWGQCEVTALLVQDAVGGEILRGIVDGVTHYWNRLDGGDEVDMTREQFPRSAAFAPYAMIVDHASLLRYIDTARRYHLLRARVLSRLDESLHPDDDLGVVGIA